MTFGKLIGITTVSLSGLFASVSTLAQTDSIVDVRDGKTYKTIKIGSQWWLAQNLAYAPMISHVAGSFEEWKEFKQRRPDSIYLCYVDSTNLCEQYGVLYTWQSAMEACPSGWHLPSDEEYETLLSNVGRNKRESYGALIKGGTTGFDALLGGGFLDSGGFGGFREMNKEGFYWTSTNFTKHGRPYSRLVDFYRPWKRVALGTGPPEPEWALSVRCVKDE